MADVWTLCAGRARGLSSRHDRRGSGRLLVTEDDIARVCDENSPAPEELEYEIDEFAWADARECSESPQAKAYALLKELNLGCSLDAEGRKAGRIEFIEGGWHPGSSERSVELRNDLTVSLLQAHIIERDIPLKITIDEV